MARWRAIHASITTDGKVNRLSEFGQLLYDRMVVKADDWGIISGDTLELKGETVPLSSRKFQEIEDTLQEMAEQSLIWRYEPEGFGPLVQIRKFDEHQPGALISKRTAPKLPLHPEWRPIADDDRSVTLLGEVVGVIPGVSDLLQEITGNGGPRVDKSKEEESKEDKDTASPSGKQKSIKKPRKSADTPHQRVVDGYLERNKGYEKRHKEKFKGDLRAIKQMLERGHSDQDILDCYDSFKAESFWARQHLSMVKLDESIDHWKKAGGKRGAHKQGGKAKYDYLNRAAAERQAARESGA